MNKSDTKLLRQIDSVISKVDALDCLFQDRVIQNISVNQFKNILKLKVAILELKLELGVKYDS